MSQQTLERLALAASGVLLGAAVWFWQRQLVDVIELLRMAYG